MNTLSQAFRLVVALPVMGLVAFAPPEIARSSEQSETSSSFRFLRWFLGWDVGASGVMGGGNRGRGELWVVDLDGGMTRRIVSGAGFARPVFDTFGGRIVAMRDGKLVAVGLESGHEETLVEDDRLIMPISVDESGDILAARQSNRSVEPVVVSDGSVVVLADFDTTEWERVFRGAQRARKEYPDGVIIQTKAEGSSESSDIFVTRGGHLERVTDCSPGKCIQPVLDFETNRIAYIRVVP